MKDHRYLPAVLLFLAAIAVAYGCGQPTEEATASRAGQVAAQPVSIPSPAALALQPAAIGEPIADQARAASPDDATAAAPVQPAAAIGEAGYGDKPKIDPVKVNGPIFTDPRWEQVQAAVVISGEQLGYLEPCGCAGLENQKGGFKRRHTLIKQLAEERGWALALIDNGGLVRRYGPQQEIKYDAALKGLRTMGYAALGIGAPELQLPTEVLVAAAADETNPFVSANVGFDVDAVGLEQIGLPSRVIVAGDFKIGVTAVLGDAHREEMRNPDLKFSPAAEALAAVLPELRRQCDVLIVLAYASPDESRALAKQFNQIDLIVTAGGAEEPPAEPQPIEGARARMIEVGHKGMYAAVIGLSRAASNNPLRRTLQVVYQRVPLDARFADAPEMHELMVEYQDSLQAAGLAALCPPPVVHPRGSGAADLRGHFVGSETCGGCHTKAHEKWSSTGHAHATESLLTIAKPPRQYDPECLSCHVTGWNPQEYFAYATGFAGLDETPHLVANGCENCHGPGGAHVEAQTNGADNAAEIRALMRLTKEQAEKKVCVACHDHDNSPEFDFETYWEKVAHPWRD